MKKLNLTRFAILCCLTLSCTPKTETKQTTIINTTTQNYRFDDDEISKKKTIEAKKKTQKHKEIKTHEKSTP